MAKCQSDGWQSWNHKFLGQVSGQEDVSENENKYLIFQYYLMLFMQQLIFLSVLSSSHIERCVFC